jgi:uncharacterized membrane protein YqiK
VSTAIVVLVAVVVAIVVVVIAFRAMWRVAEPDEALIVSGFGARWNGAGIPISDTDKDAAASMGFRVVVGKGTFVIPGLQSVRRLSLSLRETDLAVACVTAQGIPVGVKGVVIFKVGDDYRSIANAARRFLGQQDQMDQRVHNVFAGHLRSIIGGMTVEQMIRERETFTSETRDASRVEMQKLGLVIDALQIQEIDDESGYIDNLGKPEAARVAKEARIAQAAADREATEAEQQAEALKAAARSDSMIRQAEVQAKADQARAEAEQAGPRAAAASRQAVVEQETKVAELEADREEMRLQSEVRKPADARAYEARVSAEAERDARVFRAEAARKETELAAEADARRIELESNAAAERARKLGEAEAAATLARGSAEAEAQRARGLAEAAGIQARAEALASNQDAVISQQIAENLPAIVEAAAKAFGGVDNMTVLNGAEGMNQLLSQVLSMGAAAAPLIHGVIRTAAPAPQNGNGDSAQPPAARKRRVQAVPPATAAPSGHETPSA